MPFTSVNSPRHRASRYLPASSAIRTEIEAGAEASLVSPQVIVAQTELGRGVMMAFTAKELDLRGSFRFHEEFAVAVKLM